ncbi:unnamed protein product, partial [Thlaspi arvense]
SLTTRYDESFEKLKAHIKKQPPAASTDPSPSTCKLVARSSQPKKKPVKLEPVKRPLREASHSVSVESLSFDHSKDSERQAYESRSRGDKTDDHTTSASLASETNENNVETMEKNIQETIHINAGQKSDEDHIQTSKESESGKSNAQLLSPIVSTPSPSSPIFDETDKLLDVLKDSIPSFDLGLSQPLRNNNSMKETCLKLMSTILPLCFLMFAYGHHWVVVLHDLHLRQIVVYESMEYRHCPLSFQTEFQSLTIVLPYLIRQAAANNLMETIKLTLFVLAADADILSLLFIELHADNRIHNTATITDSQIQQARVNYILSTYEIYAY